MPAKKSTAKKATAKKATSTTAKKATKAAAKKAVEKLATKVVDGTPGEAPAKPAAPKAHSKSVPTKLGAKKKVSNPPSLMEIQEAAYLNYLHRTRHGLPGDAQSDWIAAVDSLTGK